MSRKISLDLELLKKLYYSRKFSVIALAELFEVSTRTIQRRLNELEVDLVKESNKTRDEFGRIISPGKDYKPQTRENNGMFKHGKSIYRTIAFEDAGKPKECFHCGKTEKQVRIVIHHIDRNRLNNHPSNLRPCCDKCHMNIEHPDSIEKARKKRMENLKKKRGAN